MVLSSREPKRSPAASLTQPSFSSVAAAVMLATEWPSNLPLGRRTLKPTMSASRAASESTRRPPPPTWSGMGRSPPAPARVGRIRSMVRAKSATRSRRTGRPSSWPRSWSDHPVPRPSSKRPSDSRWSVSASFATTAAGRNGLDSTSVPRRRADDTMAAAPSAGIGADWSSRWSETSRASKPRSSACQTRSRQAAPSPPAWRQSIPKRNGRAAEPGRVAPPDAVAAVAAVMRPPRRATKATGRPGGG